MAKWITKKWFKEEKYYLKKNSERLMTTKQTPTGKAQRVRFFKNRLNAKRFARNLNKKLKS